MAAYFIPFMIFGLELAQDQLPIRFHGFRTVGTQGGEMVCWLEAPAPPRKVRTLKPEEEKRVRVVWGEIERWKGSDAMLVLNGRLFIESADGKRRRPLDFAT